MSDDPLNKIIKDIDKEAQKHYKIIEEWKTKDQDTWKEKTRKLFLWDEFINYNDIKQKYYKILEEIKKEYTKKENIKKALLLEKVKKEMEKAYQVHGYQAAQEYYKPESMETVANYYSNNLQEYLYIKNNYYTLLEKIDSQYKKIEKHQAPKETYKKNIVERNKGKIIMFGFISGIVKGFKNASK